jgi:hypothetical protein
VTNPWLTIPLADYEGHMALPDVGQAPMLAAEFETLLNAYGPVSAALIGCAGGNGFDEAIRAGGTRLVGIDINPNYVADAKLRYTALLPSLEVYCADIERKLPTELQPVQFVYAALVFEYVDIVKALGSLRDITVPGGHLATLLQLPKEGAASASPSPFAALKDLGSIMRLVSPDKLRKAAEALGLTLVSQKLVSLPSGKQFALQVFKT